MSFARYVVLICDCDQVKVDERVLATLCTEEIEGESASELLEKAKLKGWGYHQYDRKPIHLCPSHEWMFLKTVEPSE